MSSPADIKTTYISCRGEVFNDSIKKIRACNVIFVVPINYTDKMDDKKSVPSLLYICTPKAVFIFDLITINENKLPRELLAILNSNVIKYIYSKRITYKRLGYGYGHRFRYVFDIEGDLVEHSPYCNGPEGSGSAEEIRIEDVDWSVRPFQMEEHIRAGYRIYRLMTGYITNRNKNRVAKA